MAQTIAIIDYGSGNLRSVEKAFERAARERGIAAQIDVTSDPQKIAAADRLVLPGVGAFSACMTGLKNRKGVLEALEHGVLVEGRPFLGVCVGMQLLAYESLEFGRSPGLGWIAGRIAPIAASADVRSPHMGWNSISTGDEHRELFHGLDGEAFYFAHSFHFVAENPAFVTCTTRYGGDLVAGVGRDNICGVQFHPEKSQESGLRFIGNFLEWTP